MRLRLLILLSLALSDTTCAENFTFADVHTVSIEWREVAAALPEPFSETAVRAADSAADARDEDISALSRSQRRKLASLNRAIGSLYAWVPQSAAPVLLPFDVGAYLQDTSGTEAAKPEASYFLGAVTKVEVVDAGPAGYDARLIKQLDGRARSVTISASVMQYGVPALQIPARDVTLAAAEGELRIRDFFLEDERRYAFEKFGVTYVLSAYCTKETRAVSNCDREAVMLTEVAQALRLAGGRPAADAARRPRLAAVSRPVRRHSHNFEYHAPGDLLPGTGQGRADYTVYTLMRFPIARAPAFANSQVFMDGGNCLDGKLNLVGDVPDQPFVPLRTAYDCPLAGKKLVNEEGSPANYQYPWRDNFCEQRSWEVAQCPSGVGHQGQDIRPRSCNAKTWQSAPGRPTVERCEPFLHDVVAVADGTIHRFDGAQTLNLYVNSVEDHFKVRYLHMDPNAMDTDGVTNGRKVRRGDNLGKLGNYLDGPFGTSSHLHFEMSVPTREGWVRVNPYSSLIVSYEALIGQRGREVKGE